MSNQEYPYESERKKLLDTCEVIEMNLHKCSTYIPERSKEFNSILHDIEEIRNSFINPEPITFAVLGESGDGKSTLLNSILGFKALPSSPNNVCTAGIARVRYRESTKFSLIVTFLRKDDWLFEVQTMHDEFMQSIEDRKSELNVDAIQENDQSLLISKTYSQRLLAVYGTKKYEEYLFSHNIDHLQLPIEILQAFEKGKLHYEFDSIDELGEHLSIYLKVPKFKAKEHILNPGSQMWTIVENVLIEGPFEAFKSGAELVDLPGLNDSNKAREEKTLGYLKKAKFILVAYKSVRPTPANIEELLSSRDIITDLLTSSEKALTFIATKCDQHIDEDAEKNIEIAALENMEEARTVLQECLESLGKRISLLATDNETQNKWHQSISKAPIFMTSAQNFLDLSEKNNGKKIERPITFSNLENTGIPSLRNYLQSTTNKFGPEATINRGKIKLNAACSGIQNIVEQSILLRDEKFKEKVVGISDSVSQLALGLSTDLTDHNSQLTEYLQHTKNKLLNENLNFDARKVLRISEEFKNRMNDPHWATFQAILRHDGTFWSPTSGRYFNIFEFLSKPIRDNSIGVWEDYFSNIFAGAVQGAKDHYQSTYTSFADGLRNIANNSEYADLIRVPIDELLLKIATSIQYELIKLETLVEQKLEVQKSRLSEIVNHAVNSGLAPVIDRALLERGSGMTKRRIFILSEAALDITMESVIILKNIINEIVELSLSETLGILNVCKKLIENQVAIVNEIFAPKEAVDQDMKNIADLIKFKSEFDGIVNNIGITNRNLSLNSAHPINAKNIFVLDGSNIGTFWVNNTKIASLKRVLDCVEELKKQFPNHEVRICVDSGFRHIIPKTDVGELQDFEDLERRDEIVQAPAKTNGGGDKFILELTEKINGVVVSNDAYRQHIAKYPWLMDHHRKLSAKYHKGIWIFIWAVECGTGS